MLLFMTVMSMSMMAACSSDDDDDDGAVRAEPSQTVSANEVRITNNTGSISFNSFRVVFVTANDEILTNKDYGTVNMGESITAPIPTGATEYYVGTKMSGKYFFSPNYPVSIKDLRVTYDEVMQWRSNG